MNTKALNITEVAAVMNLRPCSNPEEHSLLHAQTGGQMLSAECPAAVSSNAWFTQGRVLHARLFHDRRCRGVQLRGSLGARPFHTLRRLAAVLGVVSLRRTRSGAWSLLFGFVTALRPLPFGLFIQQGRDHFKFRQRPVDQAAEHVHKLWRLVLVPKGVNRARPLLQRVQRLAERTVGELLRFGSRSFAFCHCNGMRVVHRTMNSTR